MRLDLVGIEPTAGRRLVNLLLEAEAVLDASSRRIQALLNEAGQGSTVPLTIRGAARTCGTTAADLERRTSVLGDPGRTARPWLVAGGSTEACATPAGALPTPTGVVPTPVTASMTAIGVLGPTILVTPPAPRGPMVLYTTIGGQPCGAVVYTTGRRPGVGQPVQPPRSLPAFPDAILSPRRTPQQGGAGLRQRWRGSNGRIYEWDSQHGTVEVYNKKGTRHLGEYDPDTGKQLKPPNPARTVEP